MSEFKIGDRVVVNAWSPYSRLHGHCGTVVSDRDGYDYGVEFDECIYPLLGYGHSCCGFAKPGHGWYLTSNCLDPIFKPVSLPDVTDLL